MEAQIIRTAIIIVDKVEKNTYGDLTWTDKEGNSYKIPVKRAMHFDKIILPDMAVQLNYAMSSFGREYIYSAIQVKDKLPPPQKIAPPTARELPPKPSEIVPTASEPLKKPLDLKTRQICLSYSKDICTSGLVPMGCLGLMAEQLERYCQNELTSQELDDNIKSILKKG